MKLRQVHLDFHTSEHIPSVGEKFDKNQFQTALKAGYVDSITVFSKCHHGWSYHPTKVNRMHPGLKFDLLGAQIEAAHEIGVKTPVYISAGFDQKYAVEHPDHLMINLHEHEQGDVKDPWFGYHLICLNSPYLEELLAEIKEVVENYDADGIFLDILNTAPCFCPSCQKILRDAGLEVNLENATKQAEERYLNYTKRVRETIDSVKPGLPVFHNMGHISKGKRNIAFSNSHLELESLPTGGWGYDHFPISATYAKCLGMDYLGMTGKFHTTWGEFGGFKHPNALRYEAALSVAFGAKISIGDQLNPSGEADMATYTLIGEAYKEIGEKSEWCENAQGIADIAVLDNEAITGYYGKILPNGVNVENSTAGCTRILLEGNYLFDFIDAEVDLEKYKLLILPDAIRIDDELQKKVQKFLDNGGKILASGTSALGIDNDSFMFDFGCEFNGENEFNPDYVNPCFELDCLKNSDYVMYSKGYKIDITDGEVVLERKNPYFNREFCENGRFCSHQHTPVNPYESFPAASVGKDGAYIGWNIFGDYAEKGTIYTKKIVCHIIDTLLADNKSIKTNLPAQGIITLTKQNERHIVHLLYASPVKRGKNIDIIEDIVPVYNTSVEVKCSKNPQKVYLAPQMTDVDYEIKNGYLCFNIDKFENHQMVIIE